MSVAYIWKLQENTATLCKIGCETLQVSAIRWSGYVWPGKLKRPPLPSGVKHRAQNIRMECRRRRILDVRHPGGMLAQQNSWCETSGEGGTSLGLSGATPSGFPQEDMRRAPLSGLPQREAHGTHDHHTRTIAYPIRICCPDHCPILLAFQICLWKRTSKLRFFMVLSFPLLCHGFQRTLLNLRLFWW